jgi:hypothetical protein
MCQVQLLPPLLVPSAVSTPMRGMGCAAWINGLRHPRGVFGRGNPRRREAAPACRLQRTVNQQISKSDNLLADGQRWREARGYSYSNVAGGGLHQQRILIVWGLGRIGLAEVSAYVICALGVPTLAHSSPYTSGTNSFNDPIFHVIL